jgi:hypothetical protein
MAVKIGLLCFVLVLLVLLSGVSATAVEKEPKTRWLLPRTNITGPGPNDYECESARAADYYGIGVRLVNYFFAPFTSMQADAVFSRAFTFRGSLVGWYVMHAIIVANTDNSRRTPSLREM